MWLVVVIRLPQAIRDREQRPLWASVMLITVVTTLYAAAVQHAASDLLGSYVTYLGTHLVTLMSAAAVLWLVLAANGYHRSPLWLYLATGATAGAVLWIYLATHPQNPRPGHAPALPLGYFFLVSGFNVVALTACALVCVSGSRRVDHWAMRWALLALAVGWIGNAVPWLLNLVWLITHNPGWIAWFSQIDGVSAAGIAVGAALPLVPRFQQYVRQRNAYRRLRPLWRSLTDAIPHVRLTQPLVAGALLPRTVRLGLHRYVVEIRDAMIILRSYVGIDDVRVAQAHIARHAVPCELVDASVTACWLAAALDHYCQGRPPAVQTEDIAGVGGDDFEQEVRFLLQVADAYRSGLARSYTMTGGIS